MTFLSTDEQTTAARSSTRYFWIGLLGGALAGVGFGYLLGDLLGWAYMTAVTGSIVGIACERPAR